MNRTLRSLCTLLLLAACTTGTGPAGTASPPIAATAPPASATPSPAPTASPVPPTATLPPPSPTPVSPTPTPLPPPIQIENVSGLNAIASFGFGEATRSLAFSPDGSLLVSAGGNTDDFDIQVWDAGAGAHLATLAGHTGIVWDVAFSPNGLLLASASSDGTVRIWAPSTWETAHTLEFPGEVISLAFSPDGSALAAGGVDGFPNAAIWTFSTAGWEPQLKLSEFWNIPAIVYSPDGSTIAGGGTSRNARIWRAADGAELAILYHAHQVGGLALSPDGLTLAAATCAAAGAELTCTEGAVWLWDFSTGGRIAQHAGLPANLVDIAYTPDGSLLVLGARDGSLKFYAVPSMELVLESGAPDGNGVFTLSPDGRRIATAGNDGLIRIWTVVP